ncbi:MAG: hypothetical protein M0R80_15595 [Proteobacteria bacterium]|jgi:hypothetical protein|nr:hypothetical protein [Pseudomonadota bacterium]
MEKRWLLASCFVIAALVAVPGLAGAQEDPTVIPESTDEMKTGAAESGWHPLLKAAANFSLSHTKGVPGTVDGVTVSFGYLINAGLGYLNDTKEHEWANTLLMQLSYNKTPAVDSLVKSLDVIDFKSSYLYHIPAVPWLGPFMSFRLTTPMLPGYDVRPTATNVLRLDNDEQLTFSEYDATRPVDAEGNAIDADHPRVENMPANRQISLTGAFAPLTLKEAVGLFAMPIDKPEAKLDIRVGFGAWETFVRDGYYVDDNKDTVDLLELRQMQDAVQLGPEVGIGLTGTVRQMVTYGLNAQFMQPVYHNADTDLEGIELLNMEFGALLGVKVAEWMSVDYSFSAVKQPLLVDQWQIVNGLMISLTFNVVGGEAPPPPPCPECPACPAAEPEPAAAAAEETAAATETPAPPAAEPAAPAEPEAPAAPAEPAAPPPA